MPKKLTQNKESDNHLYEMVVDNLNFSSGSLKVDLFAQIIVFIWASIIFITLPPKLAEYDLLLVMPFVSSILGYSLARAIMTKRRIDLTEFTSKIIKDANQNKKNNKERE